MKVWSILLCTFVMVFSFGCSKAGQKPSESGDRHSRNLERITRMVIRYTHAVIDAERFPMSESARAILDRGFQDVRAINESLELNRR